MSNKKGSAPPRYDEEFKKGAMALVTEKGMPLAPFPELIDRKKYGKMEWKQKNKRRENHV